VGKLVIQETILPVLAKFEGHGLNDLKKASLMDRVDTKFVMCAQDLPALLTRLIPYFSALEIDGRRCFHYQSTYFDTPDYLFYNMHHSGRLNRFKVRIRQYIDSQLAYLEVKFKNNKGRTEKTRIKINDAAQCHLHAFAPFLTELGVPNIDQLVPSLDSQYYRIALANEDRAERLTIDIGLCNQTLGALSDPLQQTEAVILELKQARVTRSSPFFAIIRDFKVRPSGFSKYCMGLALADSVVPIRNNRFKPIIHKLKRICNLKSLERVA
jgi:hypothetical protein